MNITLVEFDVGSPWNRRQIQPEDTEVIWINYDPGVWATSIDGDFTEFDGFLQGMEEDGITPYPWYGAPNRLPAGSTQAEESITRVGSVFINNERMPDAGGLPALLALTEAGFFYDDVTGLLYVRFPFGRAPELFKIVVGISTLSSNKAYIDEESGRIYSADLISAPLVSKTIDPLFFGRIKYNDVSLELENRNGEYDQLAEYDVYGQEIRILYGDDQRPHSRFRRMWTGYLEDFTITESELIIRASDSRKLLEQPIPVRFFEQADYPDLTDRDDGKPIPVAYGTVYNVTPICVNRGIYDRTAAQAYTWKLCDTEEHDGIDDILDVRYKGESLAPVVPITDPPVAVGQYGSVDLTDATFQTYKAANETYDFRDIEVDFIGVEEDGVVIEDGLDVIVDMIDKYAGIPFSNVRYNVLQWQSITAPDVGLYIDRDSTVAQQIERIAASLRIQFDIQADGRFTAREFDPDADTRMTIRPDELLDEIRVAYTSDEFASRLYVHYQGGVLRDTSREPDIIDRYKSSKPAEFETVLTSETDAQDFADDVFFLVEDFPPLISVTVPIPAMDMEIEDNIYAILNRVTSRWLGRVKCRVEGISYNFNAETVTFDLRGFERVADEGLTIYSQGFGFGFLGFGGVLSMTQYPEI